MNYRIVHTLVGPFPNGRIVSQEEFAAVGADMEFLKRTGAIEEVKDTPKTTEPLPVGPENLGGGALNQLQQQQQAAVGAGGTAGAAPPSGPEGDGLDEKSAADVKTLAESMEIETKGKTKAELIAEIRRVQAEA